MGRQAFIRYKNILFFFAVFITVFLFFGYPLIHGGFFHTSDDVQVVRIEQMAKELRSFQFPVRYVDELGNNGGYMLFNFYSPLVYYVGAALHLLGMSLVHSTKMVFLLGYIIGFFGSFFLCKRFSNFFLGLFGAVFFISSVYIGYDVYTRGALAEFFAFMLLPWVFLMFLEVKTKSDRSSIIFAGVTLAFLITVHNITAYIASFFLLLLLFFPPYSKKTVVSFLIAITIGLLLGAFYWIPHVAEQGNIIYNQTFLGSEVYKTTFYNPWQLTGITNIRYDIRYPMLGVGLMTGALLGIVMLLKEFRTKKKVQLPFLFAAVGFLLALFMISEKSSILWETLPLLKDTQFPWRFLTVATTLAVVITVHGLHLVNSRFIKIVICFLLLLPSVTLYYQYLRPTGYVYIGKYLPEDICQTTTWNQELLPKWVSRCLPFRADTQLLVAENKKTKVTDIMTKQNNRYISARTEGEASRVTLSKYYYPGWRVSVDEKLAPLFPSGYTGSNTLNLPKGKHTVTFLFDETPLRLFADIVSFLTASFIMLYFLQKTMKRFFKRAKL